MNGFPPDHDCFSDTDCDDESPVPALIGAVFLLTAVFGALYAAFSS